MHWHWRSGYKFLRAGVELNNDGFWVHLGSAGCQGTVQNITHCRYPNRVPVLLTDYRSGDTVIADLSMLLGAADLTDSEATDCASGPAEESCGPIFGRLGLDHESGTISGPQRLFSTRTK
ncbi:MAG: MbnP family protein, partial [Woeseiaceae bacterium]